MVPHPPRYPPRRRDVLRTSGLAGLALLAGSPLLGACTRTATSVLDSGGGTFDKIKKQGYVTVGISGEAPYGYVDRDGRLTGEAPELAKIIFPELGVKRVKAVQVTFESLIPGLQDGRFDTTAAGMSILPDRCQKVTFADPEYKTLTAFLVRKGNPEHITRFGDIAKDPRIRLGVLSGAVERDFAKKLGVKPEQLTPFPDPPSAYDGMVARRIDAVALTGFSLRNLLARHPHAPFEVTERFAPVIDGRQQISAGGFAFRNADTDLVAAFNARLAALKRDGRLLRTLRPFGFTREEMPGDLTARRLCGMKL